jgi:H+/gluconate symporter-like permease
MIQSLILLPVFIALLPAFIGVWIAAALLNRRGKKKWVLGLGIVGGILGLVILFLGLLALLPVLPAVEPEMFPTPNFDLIPTI